jgi:hypothetical protein
VIQGGTQLEKQRQRLMELTIVGDFEAKLEAAVAGSASCRARAIFQFEGGGLDSQRAQETPASGDHGLDQSSFSEVARLELEHQRCGEVVEAAL